MRLSAGIGGEVLVLKIYRPYMGLYRLLRKQVRPQPQPKLAGSMHSN